MVQKKACSGVVEIPTSASRPMITLPVKPTDEGLFKGEASPGPLTLVSSFFPEKEFGAECSSISQLLAGGMSSPGFASIGRPAEAGGLRFKLGNPLASPQSSFVTIPTGISPTTLLDSPVLRPPTSVGEAPFGISHQQALAHDTAQVVQHESQIQSANEEASIVDSDPEQRVSSSNTDQIGNNPAETHFSTPKENPPSHKVAPDQPLNDGYQWKKYGQKEVKGSKFPRSYYKCKNSTCPVKKTVERSLDGEVTEIIYKGQHNHAQPRPSGCEKDGVDGGLDMESEMGGDGFAGKINRGDETLVGYTKTNKRQGLTGEESSVMSKGGGGADNSSRLDEGDDNEHDTKRRVVDSATVTQTTASNRTHTEPRLILETTSEIDLLDDGYRWRKYGQKVVKGNPHPRSYYKCTNNGCTIRKHVERSPTDPKAVITTYEGKHNHDAPVAASKVGNHHAASIQTSIIN